MSRTLKRPMFRRGGPANDGIMSGLTDRKQLSTGTRLNPDLARLESMAISNIMDELAPIPKTRLPLGSVGFALASGADPIDALGAGYQRFIKADDARQALSRFGQGIAGITPGAGSIRIGDAQAAAAGASPLMKALGLGLAGADIYGRIFT